MSNPAMNIEKPVLSNLKVFATPKAVQEILRNVHSTIEGDKSNANAGVEVKDTVLLAEGGYNTVWLITYAATKQNAAVSKAWRFVLREQREDALLPWQIENEIGFLTFIAKNHPSIPVSKVYAYDTGESGATPFIAIDYIDDKPLSQVWSTYTEEEKNAVARDIAKLIVEMAEINFDGIGGLTLAHKLGPTVEGVKLFKGRDRFHSPSCYDIGPYFPTRAYILACYDKEIYYYTHAPEAHVDMELFEETSKSAFIESLKATRDALTASPTTGLPEQPFVLVHSDFHGRNIMINENKQISAILDWEFAGSHPLSGMDVGGFEVIEMVDDETVDETFKWEVRMLDLVAERARERARERGWEEGQVRLLISYGNRDLQEARSEMFPEQALEQLEGPQELEA